MRILALAIALLLAAPASAATDFDRLWNKTKKFMSPTPVILKAEEKGLCICQDGGGFHGQVGTMEPAIVDPGNSKRISVSCRVRTFDPGTGEINGTSPCGTFFPLAK